MHARATNRIAFDAKALINSDQSNFSMRRYRYIDRRILKERENMKILIPIAIAILLISNPTRVNASDPPERMSVFFPPDASTCVNGSQNLLVWDGVHNVFCVPVPTCKPHQILFFDGHTLSCTPTP
jgi:hypothetical protein